jgi:hypothetical protein
MLGPVFLSPLLALLLLGTPAAAQAPERPTAPALQGQTVRGAKGVVLGAVERVTATPDGRAAQILVRPKGLHPGGLRSLGVSALTLGPDGVSVPITKAEFDAMPPVEIAEP